MGARIAVVVFPGTNCEHDVKRALTACGADATLVFHTEPSLGDVDGVVLPGGFAHGDYLRPGAIARFSPAMADVAARASQGTPVLGICNGFQVLTEAGLLPGALQKNAGLKFHCQQTVLRVASTNTPITSTLAVGDRLNIPINHFEGNYTIDPDGLAQLEEEDRVVVRYEDNPNGSVADIAGVCNAERNVVGMMPHPERAMRTLFGSADGVAMIESFVTACALEVSR